MSKTTSFDNDIPTSKKKELKKSKRLKEEISYIARPIAIINVKKNLKSNSNYTSGLVTLCDSGADDSFIRKDALPPGTTLIKSKDKYSVAGGMYKVKYMAKVYFTLPEFSESKIINHLFRVDETNGKNIGYDAIIGRDIMSVIGMKIDFQAQTLKWDKTDVSMKHPHELERKVSRLKDLRSTITVIEEPKATQEATDRVMRILESNYQKANLEEIASQANSLTPVQKGQLLQLLHRYKDLFDGTLGTWGGDPIKIRLKTDAKPYSGRYYPIPHINKETFRKEITRLEELGVLSPVKQSEWGAPVFIIPKKNGTVRFITDFRKLNAMTERETYPLPRIMDTMQQMEGFQFASALDLNMGYYTIQVHPESKDYLTIVTEFGKFRYNTIPMGLANSCDIFQAKVTELLGDIEMVKCYIDDILVLSKGTFQDHIDKLSQCFERIRKAGLKLNGEKCHFGLKEIPYLGYIITQDGIKPDPKKIEAVMNITQPETVKDLRAYIGLVQYYRDMWQRRSHILSPLTEQCKGRSKQPLKWTTEMIQAFEESKQMVAKETVLNYPDWTIPFDIHTDASDKQLGAVISQRGNPLAFYSRRLTKAQRNYTTTEKELLSIVECLKQFRGVLFGYKINVYSDHKNLVYTATLSESQRVMRWRLILEEFGPNIQHIAGEDNIVADGLSRLPTTKTDEKKLCTDDWHLAKQFFATAREKQRQDPTEEFGFPLAISLVQREQEKEKKNPKSWLQIAEQKKLSGYTVEEIDDFLIFCHEGKIYVPEILRGRTLDWYHYFLEHPGGDRLSQTIGSIAYWPGLHHQAKQYAKRCKVCQTFKKRKIKYGKLPPKIVEDFIPWHTVHIDLIGPYRKQAHQEQLDGTIKKVVMNLTCMTFVDPATGWFEVAEVPYYDVEDINNKTKKQIDKASARISLLFKKHWLDRYPRPRKVVFDNGSEFKKNFVTLLKDFDIKPKVTSVKNPTANAPVERVHQIIGQMLLTKNLGSRIFDHIDPWGDILSSIAWAIRASYHSTLKATPGQLVYHRDMIFNIKHLANWHEMTNRKQEDVNKNTLRENKNRIDYDYKVGDKVFVTIKDIQGKLDNPKDGPYPITQIFTNGTVRIQKGIVNERINIRRLEPYFE